MYKVAIFDLDGTLLDTIEDLANACNYALAKSFFSTYEVEQYKTFVGNGVYKLVERALPEISRDDETCNKVLNDFREYYNEHMIDMTKPYDGIIALLDKLKSEGIKLVVVSNKPHKYTIEIVNKYFNNKFDLVFGHRDGYNAKPDPVSVLEALKLLNLEKEECIYIGDSNVDIITARNAKVKSVGVLWGFRSEEELRNEGATYLVSSAEEIKKIILG